MQDVAFYKETYHDKYLLTFEVTFSSGMQTKQSTATTRAMKEARSSPSLSRGDLAFVRWFVGAARRRRRAFVRVAVTRVRRRLRRRWQRQR
jgi:hypothetical protein